MTETTQPDPQVVAWMRGYLREHPGHDLIEVYEAWHCRIPFQPVRPAAVMRASWDAAREPLTVADIPAGQGPASLFIGEGDEAAVWFKRADGSVVVAYLRMDYDGSHAKAALWEHLAATLPHVTTEETP